MPEGGRLGSRFGRGLRIGFGLRRCCGVGLLRRDVRFLAAPGRRLLLGVRRNGRDQRGPGFGRPGIDRDRLGRRRRTSQQFRRLRQWLLQPGGEERYGGFAAARSAAVGGNDVRVLVARRPLALAAAHLLAQVRRGGIDRSEIVDGAERRLQPAQPTTAAEAALQQLRRAHRARLSGGCAKHDGDQPLAVARRGRDQVVAGSADEAGLEAVGAGIASDQLVEILRDPAAVADRRNMHEVFVFRQVANDGARQDREITRRRHLPVGRQAVRIDVARLRHAELCCGLVHHRREAVDRAADALGEHHGHVVGRLHHHHLQRVVDGDLNARTEAHLGWRLRGGGRGHRQHRIERQTPFLHRLQRDVGRHDLGHRRGVPGHGRVVGLQDFSGIGLDDQQRFGVRDTRRHDGKRRRKEDPVERVARQQASKMHFCVPVL